MSATPEDRRSQVAAHPLRARLLAELMATPISLTPADCATATGQSVSLIRYHLRTLADAGWINLNGSPDRTSASVPEAVRGQLQTLLDARATERVNRALGDGHN